MKIDRVKLGIINTATHSSKVYYDRAIKNALDAIDDVRQDQRLMAAQCKFCFYMRGSRMAGQAFTRWYCSMCSREDRHHNTATPKVCQGCAKKHRLCTSCGGDQNLTVNRRKVTYENQ